MQALPQHLQVLWSPLDCGRELENAFVGDIVLSGYVFGGAWAFPREGDFSPGKCGGFEPVVCSREHSGQPAGCL